MTDNITIQKSQKYDDVLLPGDFAESANQLRNRIVDPTFLQTSETVDIFVARKQADGWLTFLEKRAETSY